MRQPSQRATLAEIYNVLNDLVDAYGKVMITFETIVTEIGELKTEVQALREFVHESYTDAVAGRDVWRYNAEMHKAEIERLRQQLQEALGNGQRSAAQT